jgi:hypothetical protein
MSSPDPPSEDPSSTLHYHSPEKPPRKFKLSRGQLGCLGVIVFVVVACSLPGMPSTVVGPVGIAMAVAGVVACVMYFRSSFNSMRPTSEDDDDLQYEARKKQREDMVAAAVNAYPNGPLGTWRFADLEIRGRNFAPLVHEERIITFHPDGTGNYVWSRGLDSQIVAQSSFDFRASPATLQARLTSPVTTDWFPVDWSFNAHRGYFDVELFVEFESSSPPPLPEALAPSWPFWGEFQRQP